MARFQFRLQTLLKLRRAERDQRREKLAEAHAAAHILEQRLERIAADIAGVRERIRTASQPGEIDVGRLLDHQRFERVLRAESGQITEQKARIAAEIDVRRRALVEADQKVRVLEKLREKAWHEHRAAEERVERNQLDEIAGVAAQRRPRSAGTP